MISNLWLALLNYTIWAELKYGLVRIVLALIIGTFIMLALNWSMPTLE